MKYTANVCEIITVNIFINVNDTYRIFIDIPYLHYNFIR
jgi:hypothetical protein